MVPCINCITFAMCKAQVTGSNPYGDIVNKLLPKCSIIAEYTISEFQHLSHTTYSPRKVIDLGQFFNYGEIK